MIGSGQIGIEVESIVVTAPATAAVRLLSATRLLAVTGGSGVLAVAGREHALAPGAVALVAPSTQHRFIVRSGGLALVQMRLRTRCLAPQQAIDRHALDLLRRLWAWSRRDGAVPSLPAATRRVVAGRLAALAVERPVVDLVLKAGVLDLLALLAAALPAHLPEDPPRGRTAAGLRAAISHLDRTRDRPLAVEELCAIAGLGRSRFDQLFRAATGLSANAYHVRARLERAAELLRDQRCSVLDVGLACGFASASRFYEAFTRLYGLSPGRYRRRLDR